MRIGSLAGVPRYGLWRGMLHSGIRVWLNDLKLGFLVPWTLRHHQAVPETLLPLDRSRRMEYPKPESQIWQRMQRLHVLLLVIALIIVGGAVAGSHGF